MASNSPDLARIKRNVSKMAGMNAPESDIDGYIASEGVTIDQVRDFEPMTPAQQRFAAEDAARVSANEQAPWYEQLGTGIKTQSGRTMLGVYELANNLTGDRLMDAEVLAEAQREADRSDKGTGAAGFVGNMAGDFRNYLPLGGAQNAAKAKTLGAAVTEGVKVGAISGGLTGLTEGTGNADSTILTNAGNAAIGAGMGAGIGAAIPVGISAAKNAGSAISGGANRAMAALGSDSAAMNVAYSNVAKRLKEQGYAPGEVAGVIDAFKAQGIDGGTLGQMLQSGDLLAREKHLLQGGGKAGRIMGEKLSEQPRKVAESILEKVRATAQPDQTNYLYKQAAELADMPTARDLGDRVVSMGQSASEKELPFTLSAIEQDLAERADELPSAVAKRIKRIISEAKGKGGFEAADTAKQKLDDLYKPNSQTTDQDIVNEIVLGYRRMLNDSLEAAGGDTYSAAKQSAMRDMAMRDVEEAVMNSQGSSVKTALNKFFGSMEQQEEFLRKLPDDRTRAEFRDYLENIQKVSGRFGGSDTASNTVTQKQMGIETGLGFDANALNPQSWVNRLSAPINRNVRKAQAEMTFAPDGDRIAAAMRKGDSPIAVPAATIGILSNESAKGAIPEGEAPPAAPAVMPRAIQPQASTRVPESLVRAEGSEPTAYTDTTGNRTIGVGFNMDDPTARTRRKAAGIATPFDAAYAGKANLSSEEVDRLALADAMTAEKDARGLVRNFDRLGDNQKAALVQMAYQLGGPRMAGFRPTLNLIEQGKFEEAAKRLKASKYARQTPGRVEALADMLARDAGFRG